MVRVHPRPTLRPRLSSRAMLAAPTLALVVLCAACGGGSSSGAKAGATTTVAPGPSTTSGGTASGGAGAGAGAGSGAVGPAATGTLASISGDTLEVQNPSSGQTTVTVGSSTTITETVVEPASAIVVGDCVTVSGPAGTTGAVTATTVSLSSAVDGSCSSRRGGFGGGGFGGGGGAFTGSRPSGSGSGSAGAGGSSPRSFPPRSLPANFSFVVGTVSAVSGTTLTVMGSSGPLAGRRTSSTSSSSSTTAPAATAHTVNLTSTTRITKTERVGVSALGVNECVVAFGTTNSIGAVAATRMTVTQPTSSGCTTGFGRFGGGGAGGAGGAAGDAASGGSAQ